MSIFITILAFTVAIPLVVGVRFYKRIPFPFINLTILCGVWTVIEVYSYVLRYQGINNAHVTYFGSTLEFILYSSMFVHMINSHRWRLIRTAGIIGAFVPLLTWLIFRTQIATAAFAIEYAFVLILSVILISQIAIGKAEKKFLPVVLTIVFYILSGFPYLFAHEWLRTLDIQFLIVLGITYSVIHSICYLVFAYLIWKSSSR